MNREGQIERIILDYSKVIDNLYISIKKTKY